ncbi:SNF2 domain-containing protein CLASSY 3-like [Gastrolobium bilobum]|uniref:SNF2 domain-containing protein CLASSY 3-like n=1 Tax=Gastrolobium bilobum TaxID=150636 RepID=UPI002AAF8AC3|nr:SNF2 domain-containing protein CLASSY 3-like [Gastrolobium bilobum]
MHCSSGVAGRTRSRKAPFDKQQNSHNVKKQSNVDHKWDDEVVDLSFDDDNDVIVFDETEQESETSHSESETSYSESEISDSESEYSDEEVYEAINDDVERRRSMGRAKRETNAKMIDFGVWRRKAYGLDLLIDENARDECSSSAQRTRSHFLRNKKLKMGTFSQPICLDEEDEEEQSLTDTTVEPDLGETNIYELSVRKVHKKGKMGKLSRKKHIHDSLDFHVFETLQDCINGKVIGQEPKTNMDFPPKFTFIGDEDEEQPTPEKSEISERSKIEKELDEIWDEMASCLNASQDNSGGFVEEKSSGCKRDWLKEGSVFVEKKSSGCKRDWLEEEGGFVEKKSSGHKREGYAFPKKKQVHDIEDFGVINILQDSIYGKGEVPVEANDDELNPKIDLPPLKFTFLTEEPQPVEKSEYEKELDALWIEMDYCLNATQHNSIPPSQVQDNIDFDHDQYPLDKVTTATLCRQGKHHLILNEEIGLLCAYCPHVQLEIKYILPPLCENPYGKSNRRDYCTFDPMDQSVFDELRHGIVGHDDYNLCDYAGTVWDIIPGVKKTMYPHQCDAFEFLWSNLAGGIFLDKLKKQKDFPGASGCIISHAPGTGKTRLTIVFLQTYMELYPTCRPMIIAPKGMLLTWEEEFKTWKVDIPFHNLNNSDYSGKESEEAMNLVRNSCRNVSTKLAKLYCRVAKLYSWKCNKSILGISYKLFEQLTSQSSNDKELRKVLLEHPGLLVLDEGHTPRNSHSLIWKSVSEIQTKRRIILSGTPFQNNFDELYNTLCLARPKFAERNLSGGGNVVFDDKRGNPRNESKGKWVHLTTSYGKVSDDNGRFEILKEIRDMISPFVHVHKGTILQERLPGLRKLVVFLKPTQLQKEIFEDIQKKRTSLAQGKIYLNVLKLEYEESVAAVHPALFSLSEGKEKFQRFRLNPEEGVKTKFLMELIRLCGLVNEKVLVFSQYIDPLNLLASQLKYHFGWNQGREVLIIHGKVEVKLRQASIKAFNDPSSNVRVMLASTKACYEGISLVGASRVVLLDVVWNPSVERQAISRAYRLGQKKFVYTYHLITAGTMDEDKCCRQAEKDQLSELVFFNSHGDGAQKFSSLELEDRILEDMVQHEKFQHIFERVAINH